jgi:isopenicillin N synthase-like dioxygenase
MARPVVVAFGSSIMSGAGTTLGINPLFFRKTTSTKTRSLERKLVRFPCVDIRDGVSYCMVL